MNALFDKVQAKLHEARISDINHELGKVKENLVNESSAYFQNLRADASSVGSLIRSESTRFWANVPSWKVKQTTGKTSTSISSSTSLPAISPYLYSNSKYKYKSSITCPIDIEEEQQQTQSQKPNAAKKTVDESVIDRFIRVVESKNSDTSDPFQCQPRRLQRALNTREEIRKKLAFNSSSEVRDNGYRKGFQNADSDLQICFINEAVSDEEEDEGNNIKEDQVKSSKLDDSDYDQDFTDDEEDSLRAGSSFPRSKSDWESLRQASRLETETVKSDSKGSLDDHLSHLQQSVQKNLKQCQKTAKTQILQEKQKQREKCPLKALIGYHLDELSEERLKNLNIASLQVVVNHCHSEIERLNEDLVNALLKKDELQIEQDSQLLDIEDLSHAILK